MINHHFQWVNQPFLWKDPPFCMGFTPKKKRVITLFKHRAAPEGKGGGHHQDQRNDEGGRPRVVVIPLGASIG